MVDKFRRNSGFSLVEIVLVLVIIGFIATGVVAGAKMVKQEKVISVISKFTTYKNFYDTFKQQNNAIVGDAIDATSLLSDVNIINGNGNSLIDGAEPYYVWREFQLFGMLEQNFVVAAEPDSFILGQNVPFGPHEGSSFVFEDYNLLPITGKPNIISNVLLYANPASKTQAGATTTIGVLGPAEAYQIDKKIDDGIPTSGLLFGSGLDNAGCSTGTLYNIGTGSSSTCGLALLLDSSLVVAP